MTDRDERNLNPTPQARMAMYLWGEEYADQKGGSMDFWDLLSDYKQRHCKELVAQIFKDALHHKQITGVKS